MVQGYLTYKMLIDSGANMDCISRPYASQLKFKVYELNKPLKVSRADDSVSIIDEFVVAQVVVEDILCSCALVILSDIGISFDVLLGQGWRCGC
jgi:hypothetical protein